MAADVVPDPAVVSFEFDDADGWDLEVAGLREAFRVTRDTDGNVIERVPLGLLPYSPSQPGDATSAETRQDIDGIALGRAAATGTPCAASADRRGLADLLLELFGDSLE